MSNQNKQQRIAHIQERISTECAHLPQEYIDLACTRVQQYYNEYNTWKKLPLCYIHWLKTPEGALFWLLVNSYRPLPPIPLENQQQNTPAVDENANSTD